jgi:hypothetical protein
LSGYLHLMGKIPTGLLLLAALLGTGPAAAAQDAGAPEAADTVPCPAPAAVCQLTEFVYPVAGLLPVASAVLVAPNLLVTSRHVVADVETVTVALRDGSTRPGRVVPTSYPGDLVLIAAPGVGGEAFPPVPAPVDGEQDLYVIGTHAANGAVAIYAPGRLIVPLAEQPLARIHHTAQSARGNSGGALVDGLGRLVGIVTTGTQGRNEAIPATEIDRLRDASGAEHAAVDARIGLAYRNCADALRAATGREAKLPATLARVIIGNCGATGSRQLLDVAAQVIARTGRLDRALELFAEGLAQDSNAVNARFGVVTTLLLAGQAAEALPHITWLLGLLPADPQLLQLALQAGKWAPDEALAQRALALIEKHHPQHGAAARAFLKDDRPPPG